MARSKYRNKKTVVDGITFASKKEAARYGELKLLERAGEISHLELQPKIKLKIKGKPIIYDSGRQAAYIGDFRYYDERRGIIVVEDTKGMPTPTYKLKKAIVKAMGVELIES